jgi:hypothetical protein
MPSPHFARLSKFHRVSQGLPDEIYESQNEFARARDLYVTCAREGPNSAEFLPVLRAS